MKIEQSTLDSFNSIDQGLNGLRQIIAYDIESFASSYDTVDELLSLVTERVQYAQDLDGLADLLKKIRLQYCRLHEALHGAPLASEGATSSSESKSDTKTDKTLRQFKVEVTQGMINQSLLTLTKAIHRDPGLINEEFEITLPNGKIVTSKIVQPGNRLQARAPISEFYKESEIAEGDELELKETKRGKWVLSLVRRSPTVDELVKRYS